MVEKRFFLERKNLESIGFSQANLALMEELAKLLLTKETAQPLAELTGTGLLARTGDNAYATRTITGPAAGITVTNGDGVAGNPTLALANDLAALEGLASTGIAVRTATDTWAQRTLQAPAAGFSITNPAGIAGDPTFALTNDLSALEGLGSTGLAARTAADTWAQRTLTAPAAGFTITNPAGVAGNPTFVLANDLAALEALTGTNTLYYRSNVDTWSPVTIGGNLTFSGGTLDAVASTSEASNAEIWTGSSTTKYISPAKYYTAQEPQTATSSATITLDGTAGLNFQITLDTNATLANPSNFQTGRHGIIRITQDGTGSRTMLFGSNWRFPGGTPSLSAAAGAIDVITFFVWSGSMIIATMDNDYAASSGTGFLLLGGDMEDVFGDALLLGGDMTDGNDKVRIQEN